jgi:hypothetical protein
MHPGTRNAILGGAMWTPYSLGGGALEVGIPVAPNFALEVAVVRDPDECFQRHDSHKFRINQVIGQSS